MNGDDITGCCSCIIGGGCDEEGDPGCVYCRSLDSEWPCPAELAYEIADALSHAAFRVVRVEGEGIHHGDTLCAVELRQWVASGVVYIADTRTDDPAPGPFFSVERSGEVER